MAKFILASASPRRKQLLEAAETDFEIITAAIDETPPADMIAYQVPEFLARKKAAAVAAKGHTHTAVVAADTVVILEGEILGKPADAEDACRILGLLSGKMHEVVTGVCILYQAEQVSFSTVTQVFFRPLTELQIRHYVTVYRPFDKAGAYAIQEWIGLTGIERINGDYYNVMGLPVGEVLPRLREIGIL